MVTQDQLRGHIGRRPFKPFRITLADGEMLEITQTAQAVAMPAQLVVAMPSDDHFRWIRIEQIDRVEACETRGA